MNVFAFVSGKMDNCGEVEFFSWYVYRVIIIDVKDRGLKKKQKTKQKQKQKTRRQRVKNGKNNSPAYLLLSYPQLDSVFVDNGNTKTPLLIVDWINIE